MHAWSVRAGLLLCTALLVAVAAPVTPARAAAPPPGWIRHNAIPLSSTDPAAPLADLAPVQWSVGAARVVGLGESVHGAAEELTLKQRVLRLLVERMGFRSIAWEEDWTTGQRIDDYLRTGKGDLAELVGEMSPQWPSREVADVLRWLRAYNETHADQVRFVGLDFYLLRSLAYDAVAAYVAKAAPGRLPTLRRDLDPIRPSTPDIWKYVQIVQGAPDKRPYLRHAHAAYDLVAGLPHHPGDRAYALALQDARQIVSFYEFYSLPAAAQDQYRDAHAAQNLAWWGQHAGHGKIAYWAASAHVAVDASLRIVWPQRTLRYATVGWYLRQWYGTGYRPVGFTFDHGAISGGPGLTTTAPPPAPGWFEAPFGAAGYRQFALDLRGRAPAAARQWLHQPVTTRAPDAAAKSYVAGTSLDQWFDLIIHRQQVSPAHPLTPPVR